MYSAAARFCNPATRRSPWSSRDAATRISAARREPGRGAAMTATIKPETAPYLDAFRSHEGNMGEPDWLLDRRAAALKQFAALGFPTRRKEPWRFTNLAPLERAVFPPAPPPEPAKHRLLLEPYLVGGAAHRIVLIDGHVVPELSPIGLLPKGVWLGSTARALAERPDLADAGFDERD